MRITRKLVFPSLVTSALCLVVSLFAPGLSLAEGQTSYTLENRTWYLIGIPAELPSDSNTLENVFGDDIAAGFGSIAPVYGTDWAVYKFDEVSAGVTDYTLVGLSDVLDNNLGYWIAQTSGVSIVVELPIGAQLANAIPIGQNKDDQLFWQDSTNSWIAKKPGEMATGYTGDASSMMPYGVVNYLIALYGVYPSRSSVEPFVGEVMLFGGNFAIRGWAFCNGQLLDIANNTALFSLLGNTYGGDGQTTFGLPDLRGRTPIHAGQGPGLSNRRLGDRGGLENHMHALIEEQPPQ